MSKAYGLAASRLSSALAWSGIRTIHSSFGVAETDIVVVEADTVAQKAKMPFYGNHEPNLLIRIMDVMLLYWWSAGPPSVFSMDSPGGGRELPSAKLGRPVCIESRRVNSRLTRGKRLACGAGSGGRYL